MHNTESLDYYRTTGNITKLDKYVNFLSWLTDDPRAIYQVVQGLLVHDLWAGNFGISLNEKQVYQQNIAYMEDLLDKAIELDSRSLSIPRSPEHQVICCCREFATLMCAILRHKGIPARSRCGFATYFSDSTFFEDHWICEYWTQKEKRWIMVDPQIDPFQQSTIEMKGNPLDLTQLEFIIAGKAWKMCRFDEYNPDKFGIGCDPKLFGLDSLYGLWFIRGNLLRDFAALNKVEIIPFLVRLDKGLTWDSWELISKKDKDMTEEEISLLDTVAELSINPDSNIDKIQRLFVKEKRLQPPNDILSRHCGK